MRPLVGQLRRSIQTRLLIAVSLLALATLTIGLASLYWLNRSNQILTELHNTTIEQVNRSHELTRQSSVFATSVPFLLNLRSPYLIESEGSKLLTMIDSSITSWQNDFSVKSTVNNQSSEIVKTLSMLRSSMVDLMSVVGNLADGEDQTRRYTAELSVVNKQILNEKHNQTSPARRTTADQAEVITSLLFAASHANSLLSLGEYRRSYLEKSRSIDEEDNTSVFNHSFSIMHDLAVGENGLFNTRYKVLQHNISTRRALSNISSNVSTLSELVLDLIQRSEIDIASRRKATSDGLKNAIVLVAIVGLGAILLAVLSALYISGYVVRNLNTVTTAMTALADGNLEYNLPIKGQRDDEIGRLRSTFNVFQKNAFNLNRLNRQLEQKSAQFESTFNNINDGVSITDATGLVLANNPRLNQLLSLFGNEYEVSVGSNLEDKIADITEHIGQPRPSFEGTGHTELRNPLGQVIEVRTSILPDGGHVWLFSDTTERRRVEEKLRHFQRLESLGQLTGEVAHDVNNVLSAIQTTVPRILSSRTDKASHKAAVDRINDAVEIGSSLTHRLLAFAKRQQLEPRTIELNELVSGVSDLISLSMGERIEFIVKESTQKAYVTIDPLQLESALLNLCLNSAHAIEGYGTVTISVGEASAQLANIIVTDNGCGMSEDVVRRAIEPFFSTQQGSSGSGLGLSIVYGFIKQSGGDLQITSAPGDGTTVQLFLPGSDSKNLPERRKTSSNPDSSTVLIVEDSIKTLKWAVQTLRGLGFQTIEASDADTALAYIESNAEFSVLFTDLHLGGSITGWDLTRQLLRINPDMRIIVTSGRFNRTNTPPTDLTSNVSLLDKPYTQGDIAQLLCNIDD